MVTPAQREASRRNGSLSRRPKTVAGKSRPKLNALKHGEFADGPVVAAVGESATEWTAFKDAVVADLAPEGAVEYRLAVRLAELQWRLLRMTRIEAAAVSPNLDGLPPDPATVGEAPPEARFRPPPAHAPVEVRLAWVRGQARGGQRAAADIRAIADQLEGRPGAGDRGTDFLLTGVVARTAGWRRRKLTWSAG